MKRALIVGIGIITVGGIIWAGIFYWKNLRGVGPALRVPKEDIAELLHNPPQPPLTLREGENRAGIPLKLPPGFSIEIFAKDLPGARVMARFSDRHMWVSQTGEGKISELIIKDGKVIYQGVVRENLRKPHGIVVDPQNTFVFYFAEEDAILRDDRRNEIPNPKKIVDLPTGGGHFTRTLGFGPDGRLYVSIGSSCNVCNEKDERRAAIYVVDIENKKLIPYAIGLRNSVFFTWSYVDGRMWATEMGRDLLGDDLPPDEINIIREGKNYGWPICYGKNIFDPTVHKNDHVHDVAHCSDETPSYIDLPAHSAPLGLAFIPEEGWPEDYWYDLLVAYHGSWNRSTPTGYKVVRLKLDAQGNYEGTEDFITGWLKPDGTVLGRPVDILVQPGGTVYISDDKAGVIYRVRKNVLE